jgi:hypothetical protein
MIHSRFVRDAVLTLYRRCGTSKDEPGAFAETLSTTNTRHWSVTFCLALMQWRGRDGCRVSPAAIRQQG